MDHLIIVVPALFGMFAKDFPLL